MASFAAVIRTAAKSILDIDPSELSVGVQPRLVQGTRTAMVYVADSLQNGAGYSTELAREPRVRELLAAIEENVTKVWQDARHADCDSSCADCLRSYDNRFQHGLLDWRLALDVADLATGRPLDYGRWFDLAPAAAQRFCNAYEDAIGAEIAAMEIGPLHAVVSGGRGVLLGHPLWRRDQPSWNSDQKKAAKTLQGLGVEPIMGDVRTARSAPDEVFSMLIGEASSR